jgi:hypothetical protein
VEVSRKHGPFDTRWPALHTDGSTPAPTLALDPAEAAEALDWDAFSSRYFPGRSRHDSQAQSAYANYKQGHEWRSADPQGSRSLRLVPAQEPPAAPEEDSEETGSRPHPVALAAVQSWEGEGGLASREPS